MANPPKTSPSEGRKSRCPKGPSAIKGESECRGMFASEADVEQGVDGSVDGSSYEEEESEEIGEEGPRENDTANRGSFAKTKYVVRQRLHEIERAKT